MSLNSGAGQAPAQLRPVISLFRKLKPESDLASFRARTRSAIDALTKTGVITPMESEWLLALREPVIEWRTKPDAALPTTFREWLERWRSASDATQQSILADLLGCLPKGMLGEEVWWPIITGDEAALRQAIIEAKLVRSADLTKMAKARPADFCRSRGLETLLEMEVAVPRVVWEHLNTASAHTGGPSGIEGELAYSYSLDVAHDSSAWLIGFLAGRPELRQGVILQLLGQPASLLRLVRAIAGYGVGPNGRRGKRDSATIEALLADVISACTEAIDKKRATSGAAGRSLYLLRQLIASEPENYSGQTKSAVDAAVRPVITTQLVDLLQRAQTSKDPSRDVTLMSQVVPARGDEIAEGVAAFLAELPGTAGGVRSSGHARLERYEAVRELVEDILPLLDLAPGAAVGDSLRTALSNAGVGPIGTADERCAFDPVIHESASTDPTVGDVVRVHDPGWQIGRDQGTIVLRKARVELDTSAVKSES